MRRSPVEREAMTGDDDDKSGTAHPTKERILQAAAEVFAERGFEGASTREIAAKAQVNISSLHYHWASKDALYIAIVARVLDSLRERVRQSFIADAEGFDARQLIERALGGVFDFFADNPRAARAQRPPHRSRSWPLRRRLPASRHQGSPWW